MYRTHRCSVQVASYVSIYGYGTVCIEVVHHGVPMGSGIQLGLGEGPIKSESNVPTPQYHRYRVMHVSSYLRSYALSLLWAAEGDLIPHIGVLSYRAREKNCGCFYSCLNSDNLNFCLRVSSIALHYLGISI